MTVEQALCDRLLADAGVSAVVGSRGYVLKLPQSPMFPAIRVQKISGQEPSHLRGGSRTTTVRVQVDALAAEASGGDTKAVAETLAAAVAAALMSKPPFVAEELRLSVVRREEPPEGYVSEELRQVMVPQDFIVWSTATA